MRMCAAAFVSLAIAGCGEDPVAPATPSVFIALNRDFEPFEGWTRFARIEDRIPPAHTGRRSFVYASRMPARGATHFAVGTMLMRVDQLGDDPTHWEVHAMAKRGGGFNPDGADDWEFFGIQLDGNRRPAIAWRGEGPGLSGDGYHLPDGG